MTQSSVGPNSPLREPGGQLPHRGAVAQQHQKLCAGRQVRAQACEGGCMQGETGRPLQRPAEPRGRQRKAGGGRQGPPLAGLQLFGQ